jgi:serine phosphatase RsbU (regulator of sigma subunit)
MMHRHSNAQPRSVPTNRLQRRTSIARRLRWSYLVSSTIPLLVVGALLIAVLFRVQQRNAYASQLAVAERIADNLATFLYDVEQLLLRATTTIDPNVPNANLQASVQALANASLDIRAVQVINREGAVVAQAVSRILNGTRTTAAPPDDALIQRAVAGGQGGRTPIRRNADQQAFFQLVIPIRNPQTGALIGALNTEVSATRISQILGRGMQSQGKIAYLLDPNQTLMLSSAIGPWTPPPDIGALYPGATAVAEYLGGDGQQVVGARATISPVGAANWSVVVEQPSATFFVEVYRSIQLLTALVILVGALAFTWAFTQARRLIDPIRALGAGANELAAGNLSHRIPRSEADELGQLADRFNMMADQLQHSLREIENQNARLRAGLELARDIQQGMLPTVPPWPADGLSVYGRSLPAAEVGGDFYSYLAMPGGRAAIAIGDISGKGVAAALLMALTSSTLESQARMLDYPSAILHALDGALRDRLQANQMNAALQIAVYDFASRQITLASAGMIAPLLIRPCADGGVTCSLVEVGGLPIGTGLPAQYQDVTIDLGPGETVLVLSDGIVEAHAPDGELFGFERLETLVNSLPPQISVGAIVERIIAAVLAFSANAAPHDDATLIAIRPAIGAAHAFADDDSSVTTPDPAEALV